MDELTNTTTETNENGSFSVFENNSIDSILNDIEATVSSTIIQNTLLQNAIRVSHVESDETDVSATEEPATNESEAPQVVVSNGNDEESAEEESVESAVERISHDFDAMNSGISENVSRFSGAEWFNTVKDLDVTIAGIGGIGSYLSFMISRLHPHIMYLFDNDTVDASNMSGQLFSSYDVGVNKTAAMNSFISAYSKYDYTYSYPERYEGQIVSDIMMCGFDNMAARRLFFNKWKEHMKYKSQKEYCLFVDGRLGMEELQVFSIRGDEEENMERYEKEFLFNDSEAEQVPCSMKQTTFMAAMIGSVMTNIFVNFATNIGKPIDVRTMPFITLYNASDMRMQVKF